MKAELKRGHYARDGSVTPRNLGRDFMTAFLDPLGHYSKLASTSQQGGGKHTFGRGVVNRKCVEALI